jgi:hypothetical protein
MEEDAMILSHLLHCVATRRLVYTIVFLLIVPPTMFSRQDPQEPNQKAIREARSFFDDANFDRSIEILKALVARSNVGNKELQQAHELLALNFQAKFLLGEAEEALRKYAAEADSALTRLLALVPKYEPDLEKYPQTFAQAFAERVKKVRVESGARAAALAEQKLAEQKLAEQKLKEKPDAPPIKPPEEKAWYQQTWAYVAGGAVAVGIVVFLLAGKSSSSASSNLPGPPSMPQSSQRTQ